MGHLNESAQRASSRRPVRIEKIGQTVRDGTIQRMLLRDWKRVFELDRNYRWKGGRNTLAKQLYRLEPDAYLMSVRASLPLVRDEAFVNERTSGGEPFASRSGAL